MSDPTASIYLGDFENVYNLSLPIHEPQEQFVLVYEAQEQLVLRDTPISEYAREETVLALSSPDTAAEYFRTRRFSTISLEEEAKKNQTVTEDGELIGVVKNDYLLSTLERIMRRQECSNLVTAECVGVDEELNEYIYTFKAKKEYYGKLSDATFTVAVRKEILIASDGSKYRFDNYTPPKYDIGESYYLFLTNNYGVYRPLRNNKLSVNDPDLTTISGLKEDSIEDAYKRLSDPKSADKYLSELAELCE